ncbi:MAG: cytochrome c [Nitrospirae bacterium]|nr:cytochrome c [Nitrospirota bacterium]
MTLSGPNLGWTASAGDPQNGKARYEQYCAVCHGPRGLGDGPMAKATTPPATRLTAPEVRNKTDQDLLASIADGKGGTMPAWRGILTDQELLDVLAYVRSLQGS